MLSVGAALIGIAIGAVAASVVLIAWSRSRVRTAQDERERAARRRAARSRGCSARGAGRAREQAVALRSEIESEVQDRRVQIAKVEERVLQKELEADAGLTELERKEQGLGDREVHVKALQEELRDAQRDALAALEKISGLTVHEARQQLLERSKDLVRHELAREVRQMEEEARSDARRRARALVADSLQRVAASHTAEATVTVVELASDDLKGRIIGREGSNIRSLEHLTGVDFIIDDTPHAVVLSSFDPLRREVARMTLDKLIEDGRIHPARIEEMYYQAKAELDEHVVQAGEQAVFEANCGEFHEELYASSGGSAIGRAMARTSSSTPSRRHLGGDHGGSSKRVSRRPNARHSSMTSARRSATRSRARTRGSPHSSRAVAASRRESSTRSRRTTPKWQPQTVEAVLLIAADAISASRPGARGESLGELHPAAGGALGDRDGQERRRQGVCAPGWARDQGHR